MIICIMIVMVFLLLEVFLFLSIRRRQTRCVLVTVVQMCALPIWLLAPFELWDVVYFFQLPRKRLHNTQGCWTQGRRTDFIQPAVRFDARTVCRRRTNRSEERRVGKECVST